MNKFSCISWCGGAALVIGMLWLSMTTPDRENIHPNHDLRPVVLVGLGVLLVTASVVLQIRRR